MQELEKFINSWFEMNRQFIDVLNYHNNRISKLEEEVRLLKSNHEITKTMFEQELERKR